MATGSPELAKAIGQARLPAMLLLVASLILSSGCGDQQKPQFTDLDSRFSAKELSSGKRPAGASTFSRYWVYGVDRSYGELVSALSDQLTGSGWSARKIPDTDPVSPGALYASSPGDGLCMRIDDLKGQQAGSTAPRELIKKDDLSSAMDTFEAVVVVQQIGCG